MNIDGIPTRVPISKGQSYAFVLLQATVVASLFETTTSWQYALRIGLPQGVAKDLEGHGIKPEAVGRLCRSDHAEKHKGLEKLKMRRPPMIIHHPYDLSCPTRVCRGNWFHYIYITIYVSSIP